MKSSTAAEAGFSIGTGIVMLIDHVLKSRALKGPVTKQSFVFRSQGEDGKIGPWETITHEMREIAPGHLVPAKWNGYDLEKSKAWLR